MNDHRQSKMGRSHPRCPQLRTPRSHLTYRLSLCDLGYANVIFTLFPVSASTFTYNCPECDYVKKQTCWAKVCEHLSDLDNSKCRKNDTYQILNPSLARTTVDNSWRSYLFLEWSPLGSTLPSDNQTTDDFGQDRWEGGGTQV